MKKNSSHNFHKSHSPTPFVIGLTGGIGSGKTVVTDWFAKQGIDIVDADVIAHQIVAKGSPILNKIADTFGQWVINENGELNRPLLREHVFQNPTALKQLEAITHPAIRQEIKQQLQQATSDYVILSVPLLLEGGEKGLVQFCQHVVVVDVSEETQLKRASQRDGQTIAKIKTIMQKQIDRKSRLAQADDVICNNGSLEDLYQKLPNFHQKFLQLALK
ncbi:MAG: dephospho-CoA kinase [Moraxellaceae bacterium]|nr:dephospho-CoA kinase [Moraxellaceae bacterium]